MICTRGGASRIVIVALCVAAIVVAGAVYAANRFLYFGPGLPQRDYLSDYTQHGLVASGKSIEEAEAASAKLIEVEQVWEKQISPSLADADAHLGMLGGDDERSEDWSEIEPVVLEALDKAERLGVRAAVDEVIELGVFIDLNLIRVDGRDEFGGPRIGILRTLARLEADFMWLAGRNGDAPGVIDAYERIAGLADLAASSGGGFLSRLIAIAIRAHAMETFIGVLSERQHDPAFVEAVQVVIAIDERNRWPDIATVFEGELIGTKHLISDLGNPPIKTVNPAHQLSLLTENYDRARTSWSTHADGPVAGLREHREWTESSWRPGVLADILTPATEKFLVTVTHLELNRASQQAVMAIELHRAREGELPVSLDHLVPAYLSALPIDPFSRKPLAYRVDHDAPNGYVLYGFGSDGRDNNGSYREGRAANAVSLDEDGVDYPIIPCPK